MNDAKPFAEWIGRQSESVDYVTERLVASFRAIFEPHLAQVPDGTAPLGIHWCLSPSIAPMAELGPDGHPAKNRDLPPVPQPRRMWAGGTVETLGPLHIGDRVRRVSTIADVTGKRGRSGELWFVAVDHEYMTERGPAIRERHDIVYREASSIVSATKAEEQGPLEHEASQRWEIDPTPTLLFRYSAITFNGHRIHYDQPYATQVEGYEGLVVHGPLQATLLLNLAASDGSTPRRFSYRGLAPAFAGNPLFVCRGGEGRTGELWTANPYGRVHMKAIIAEAE
ncbi:MaoC family dehydratase N-terminal domain-containing protein [Chelativorans sp. J32]|uniref:FAS1-like dehydratase domain-containing protein n=1 Tax=Chelativorans sp. J32 TaxID=935840 RepID=UPI000485B4D9|nr:MaoC family dehydratase N-terminal domain-containing protein [Chelativorans sp. J32]